MPKGRIELCIIKRPNDHRWCIAWQMGAIWLYETACGENVAMSAGFEVADRKPADGVLCNKCRRAIQRVTGMRISATGGGKKRKRSEDAKGRSKDTP